MSCTHFQKIIEDVFVLTALKAILAFIIPVWMVAFVFIVFYLEIDFQQN